MPAEIEHGGRWNGLGPEPLTDDEWREHLRACSDSALDELCECDYARERHDAQDERDRRRALEPA